MAAHHPRHDGLDDVRSEPDAGANDMKYEKELPETHWTPFGRRTNLVPVLVPTVDLYARFVATNRESPGCRDAAIATSFLLGFAIVFMTVGLALSNQGSCSGACETTALTALYAGGPLSAVLGVAFGGVWLAWPLDVTLWVVIGFAAARFADRRRTGVMRPVLIIVAVALAYGLVLSQFVEIGI